jgi:hypothetical protein
MVSGRWGLPFPMGTVVTVRVHGEYRETGTLVGEGDQPAPWVRLTRATGEDVVIYVGPGVTIARVPEHPAL